MNWLDRTIGALSPSVGLRRMRQRQALQLMQRAYEGAKAGRRTDGWVTAGTGANAEIAPASARLRDRSRDLVRNNPYAAKAVNALVSNLVGTGRRWCDRQDQVLRHLRRWILGRAWLQGDDWLHAGLRRLAGARPRHACLRD